MSIPVAIDAVDKAMAERPYAYLLTVSDDGRPHAVAVTPRLVDGVLRASIGRRSGLNASARPDAVSLVWPPAEVGGYSLIVDGSAIIEDETIAVTPTKGVLHRPAPADAGPVDDGACGSDCVPLTAG